METNKKSKKKQLSKGVNYLIMDFSNATCEHWLVALAEKVISH
jgi:hypothetical protein